MPKPPFCVVYIIANYPSHSAYSMPGTMEQKSTSAPSIESPLGAQTDPPGTMNKLEQAMDQLNANMDMTSTLLGQLCQHIPTGECSLEARETASPNLTDTEVSGHKQHRCAESFSSDEGGDSPCMKSCKDSDTVSITASEDEVQNLLDEVTGGSTQKNANHEGAEDHDDMLKELTATFQDEDKKGPPINTQLAEMATKRWGKKLDQENCRAS